METDKWMLIYPQGSERERRSCRNNSLGRRYKLRRKRVAQELDELNNKSYIKKTHNYQERDLIYENYLFLQ